MSQTTLILCVVTGLTIQPALAVGRQAREPGGVSKEAQQLGTAFDALRRSAEEARAAGRLEEAIDLYRRALALRPSWVEGFWYLGTIHYDRDRHAECRDAFARVLEAQPANGAAWAFRGLCEFRLREYRPALEHLDHAKQVGVGDDPGFEAIVAYHRAILLARFEQFERALDIHGSLVRGGNATPDMLDAVGVAMLRLPLLPAEVLPQQRGLVGLAGVAGAYGMARMKEEARHAFEQLVERYPGEPSVHFLYGNFLMADERPDDALAQYRMELARSPDHVPARLQIGHELLKRGELDAARPYAVEAVRLAPGNYMARNLLGQIKLQDGDAAGAIVELEAARESERSSPSVRFHLARAYQRAGRDDEAQRERAEFKRLEAIQQKQRGAVGGAVGEGPAERPPQ
jgi:tetratricopeptide (TPR) repeat protein